MFGGKSKDGMKEFEQMRNALKSAERRQHDEIPSAVQNGGFCERFGQRPTGVSKHHSHTSCPTLQRHGGDVGRGVLQHRLDRIHVARQPGYRRQRAHRRPPVWRSRGARHRPRLGGAEVDAKVRAAYVVIAGSFQGQVECSERLEITPTGHFTGQLTTKSLVVHEGAFVDGQVRMSLDKPGSEATASEEPANGKTDAHDSAEKPYRALSAVVFPGRRPRPRRADPESP